MIEIEKINFKSKKEMYNFINLKSVGIMDQKVHWLSSISNISAVLWQVLDNINWAGFYLNVNDRLILASFQGKPACMEIKIGNGVCGTAAETKETQLVKNVHEFPGHIACDSASNSEIVVPIIQNDKFVGVLDIDSPILNRFDEEDKEGLEKLVNNMVKYIDFSEKVF